MNFDYDVIVIGAGHAGCEAAHAAARLGVSTLLMTIDMNKIAQMSCNPAVGGIAKGQIVREIDALGGMMGVVTDESAIQFRMLNRSKGPAVWSPRSQSDRMEFSRLWRNVLENTPNLSMWQDSANGLLIEEGRVAGVTTCLGVTFRAKCVVLTAGTFLNGLMHTGPVKLPGGRVSEPASHGLTEQLRGLGFATDRMKTGTPVRIDGRSVDWSKTTLQEGDNDFHKFSYLPNVHRKLRQRPCHTVYTNPETHRILREGLPFSPLYNGQIQSIGPRYCPSIETKIVTFADKDEHQLFLEPEGEVTNEYYLNGFSSSLPIDVQIRALETCIFSVPATPSNMTFSTPRSSITHLKPNSSADSISPVRSTEQRAMRRPPDRVSLPESTPLSRSKAPNPSHLRAMKPTSECSSTTSSPRVSTSLTACSHLVPNTAYSCVRMMPTCV